MRCRVVAREIGRLIVLFFCAYYLGLSIPYSDVLLDPNRILRSLPVSTMICCIFNFNNVARSLNIRVSLRCYRKEEDQFWLVCASSLLPSGLHVNDDVLSTPPRESAGTKATIDCPSLDHSITLTHTPLGLEIYHDNRKPITIEQP